MRTPQERIDAIAAAIPLTVGTLSFGNFGAIAFEVAKTAQAARLGWTILVNGVPCEDEWLEVSSHAPGEASDVVVILKEGIVDEYLGDLLTKSISRTEMTQRITAIDAHMSKAMVAHNVCPKE